ncbi:MAG TPA: PAS domain S-box protein [Actinoplanes sp.]
MATVLVVDDDPANRELLRTVLGCHGHEVLEAAEAAQGLRLARGQHPDVVVTDVLMPGMDGYELARELRADPNTRDTALVFYSGNYSDRELRPIADAYGVTRSVLKSADPSALLTAVDELIAAAPQPVPDGSPSAEAFHRDHTQAVNAKLIQKVNQLHASEERFRAMAESSPIGIFLTDTAGDAYFANTRLSEITELSIDQLLGTGWLACFPPDMRDTAVAATRAATGSGLLSHFRLRMVQPDGRVRWLSSYLRITLDAGGEPEGVVGMVDDVTKIVEAEERRFDAERRREADERLRVTERAEARFRGLLDAAPDAILGVDKAGSIELVNAQCERLFGYGREELIGQPIEMLVPVGVRDAHPGHRRGFNDDLEQRPMGVGVELSALRRDGTEIPVEVSLSGIETADGTLVMAAVRDVSERRLIERQLRDQNVELERASRAKDNFLASMSHELRTPLNAIIGFTGTMLMKLPGPLNADQEYQLGLVQASGKHLLSIINDLLDLAKIESGRVQLSPEPVDCVRGIEEVVQSLQPLAVERGLRLVVDAPPAGPHTTATTDRRALGQILINLVNNAIKFTGQGEIRVSLVPADGDVPLHIAVSDNGPGIPPADLERIFRAFERSATTTKSNDEGTGLGLYVSQKLAELLRARLTVASVVGQGSTFTLSLPEY